MKVSKSLNKNFSINEHFNLIEKKYKEKERISFNGKNLYAFKYYKYIYLPLIEDFKCKNSLLELNASFLKELISNEIFSYGDSIYLRFNNNNGNLYVYNDLENKSLEVDKKYIIKNNLDKFEVFFDLNLIFLNYLNWKTINHFSKVIISEDKNIFFLKRKDWISIFFINEESNN